MKSKHYWIIKSLIILSMFITGLYLYDILPAEMPIHWNAAGQVDNMAPKIYAILGLPLLTLVFMFMFPFLRSIDPRKNRYEQFKKTWEIFQLIFILFFAYLYYVTIYITLNPDILITPFVLIGIGTLFVILGNYLGKIRQNYFVGIKTPWTLHNETVWNKTHRLSGWFFMAGGIFILSQSYFLWHPFLTIIIAVLFSAIIPIIYSYIIFRKINKND